MKFYDFTDKEGVEKMITLLDVITCIQQNYEESSAEEVDMISELQVGSRYITDDGIFVVERVA